MVEKEQVMSEIDRKLLKAALKEAIKEWLDEKFAQFGRWTFFGFCSVAFAGMVYFILWANGWHK